MAKSTKKETAAKGTEKKVVMDPKKVLDSHDCFAIFTGTIYEKAKAHPVYNFMMQELYEITSAYKTTHESVETRMKRQSENAADAMKKLESGMGADQLWYSNTPDEAIEIKAGIEKCQELQKRYERIYPAIQAMLEELSNQEGESK